MWGVFINVTTRMTYPTNAKLTAQCRELNWQLQRKSFHTQG